MGQGRNGQGHVGRASAWALLGAAALLVGTVMMGSAALAAEDPPVTDSADDGRGQDPPVQTGDPVAPPAADPPVGAAAVTAFTKAFSPVAIAPGGTSTLTFTITARRRHRRVLAFTDTLPTGVTVASTPNASTTCTGPPTVTATAGSGTLDLQRWGDHGGAATSCTVHVDVTSSTPGKHDNTATGTSDPAQTPPARPATATLTVTPGFTKAFSPTSILPGGVSTLTFTINNEASHST